MQGFRLTQQAIDEGFSGGSIKATEAGHLFNLGEAFTETDPESGESHLNTGKIIVVDDDSFAEILSGHPALERVAAEAIPGDVEPIESPRQAHMVVQEVAPFTPQTTDVLPGGASNTQVVNVGQPPQSVSVGAGADLVSPVTAEHADPSNSVEGALAAGEAVSGSSQAQAQEGQEAGVPEDQPPLDTDQSE